MNEHTAKAACEFLCTAFPLARIDIVNGSKGVPPHGAPDHLDLGHEADCWIIEAFIYVQRPKKGPFVSGTYKLVVGTKWQPQGGERVALLQWMPEGHFAIVPPAGPPGRPKVVYDRPFRGINDLYYFVNQLRGDAPGGGHFAHPEYEIAPWAGLAGYIALPETARLIWLKGWAPGPPKLLHMTNGSMLMLHPNSADLAVPGLLAGDPPLSFTATIMRPGDWANPLALITLDDPGAPGSPTIARVPAPRGPKRLAALADICEDLARDLLAQEPSAEGPDR